MSEADDLIDQVIAQRREQDDMLRASLTDLDARIERLTAKRDEIRAMLGMANGVAPAPTFALEAPSADRIICADCSADIALRIGEKDWRTLDECPICSASPFERQKGAWS